MQMMFYEASNMGLPVLLPDLRLMSRQPSSCKYGTLTLRSAKLASRQLNGIKPVWQGKPDVSRMSFGFVGWFVVQQFNVVCRVT